MVVVFFVFFVWSLVFVRCYCSSSRLHESVAFVLDDVLVTVVNKKETRGAEDSMPSLNESIFHQIRAAENRSQ